MRKAPSYIYHQGKEFYCVRKYRGILSTMKKEKAAKIHKLDKLNSYHFELSVALWLRRYAKYSFTRRSF